MAQQLLLLSSTLEKISAVIGSIGFVSIVACAATLCQQDGALDRNFDSRDYKSILWSSILTIFPLSVLDLRDLLQLIWNFGWSLSDLRAQIATNPIGVAKVFPPLNIIFPNIYILFIGSFGLYYITSKCALTIQLLFASHYAMYAATKQDETQSRNRQWFTFCSIFNTFAFFCWFLEGIDNDLNKSRIWLLVGILSHILGSSVIVCRLYRCAREILVAQSDIAQSKPCIVRRNIDSRWYSFFNYVMYLALTISTWTLTSSENKLNAGLASHFYIVYLAMICCMVLGDRVEEESIKSVKATAELNRGFVRFISLELLSHLNNLCAGFEQLVDASFLAESTTRLMVLEMQQSCGSSLQILNDVLIFDGMSTDDEKKERGVFNVNELIRRVVKELEPLMSMKGVDLAVEVNLKNSHCTNHSKISLYANGIEIEQALKYLLRHAINISNHGSTVRLQGSVTARNPHQQGDHATSSRSFLRRRRSSSKVAVEQLTIEVQQQHLQQLGFLELKIIDTGPVIRMDAQESRGFPLGNIFSDINAGSKGPCRDDGPSSLVYPIASALLNRNDCHMSLFPNGGGGDDAGSRHAGGSECAVVLPLYERNLPQRFHEELDEIFDNLDNNISHFDVELSDPRRWDSSRDEAESLRSPEVAYQSPYHFPYHRPSHHHMNNRPNDHLDNRRYNRRYDPPNHRSPEPAGSDVDSPSHSSRGGSDNSSVNGQLPSSGMLSRSLSSFGSLVSLIDSNLSSMRVRLGNNNILNGTAALTQSNLHQRRRAFQDDSNVDQFVDIEEAEEDDAMDPKLYHTYSLESCDQPNPGEFELINYAVKALWSDISAECVSVFAFNELTSVFECIATQDHKKFKMPINTTIASSAFQSCKVMNVAWTQLHSLNFLLNETEHCMSPFSAFPADGSQAAATGHNSVLCAPIIGGSGRPIGVVEVVGKGGAEGAAGAAAFSMIDERVLCECCSKIQPLVASLRDAMSLSGLVKHSTSQVFSQVFSQFVDMPDTTGDCGRMIDTAATKQAAKQKSSPPFPFANTLRSTFAPPAVVTTPGSSFAISDAASRLLDDLHNHGFMSGSSSSISQPSAEHKTAKSAKLTKLAPQIRLLRCLVADDSKPSRKVLTYLLHQRLGHTVVETDNGAEACRLVEEAVFAYAPFDVVFLDCEMPGMDGPAAARQMVTMGFRGKIVGFTGFLDADTDAFRLYGVKTILEKPLKLTLLQRILADVYEQSSPPTGTAWHAQNSSPSATLTQLPADDPRRLRFLVIDGGNGDKSVSSRILRRVLEQRLDHEVEMVSDANSAAALLRAATASRGGGGGGGPSFDAVIIDYTSPTLDGPDVARAVRINGHGDRSIIGIVAPTYGTESQAAEQQLFSKQLNALLRKPLQTTAITQAVRDIYSSQSTLRGRVGEGFNKLPYTENTKEGGTQRRQQQQHQQESAATSVRRRFLVVDDVTSNRKVLCQLLNKAGHSAVQACDGLGALEQFDESLEEHKPFDAIFMDFIMPSMDGPTATSIPRRRGYRGPIFGVTGNALQSEVDHFLAHGATLVLDKPLRSDKMDKLLKGVDGLAYTKLSAHSGSSRSSNKRLDFP